MLVEAAVMAFMYLCSDISLGIIESLLLSQLIVLVPAVLFLFGTKTDPGRLIAHNRPKFTTALLVVVFTFLCMPAIIAVNAFSMLSALYTRRLPICPCKPNTIVSPKSNTSCLLPSAFVTSVALLIASMFAGGVFVAPGSHAV